MLKILIPVLFLMGCTTVYMREKTTEPLGGVVAIRGGDAWSLEYGPSKELVYETRKLMVSRCGGEAFLIDKESVEPTYAGSYWSFPVLGIWSKSVYAEEYRYRFRCAKGKVSG